jgi:hypothetical protein
MKNGIKRAVSLTICLVLALGPATGTAGAASAQEPVTVSLDNIYALAYENNPNIKITDLNLEALYDGIEQMEDANERGLELSKLRTLWFLR